MIGEKLLDLVKQVICVASQRTQSSSAGAPQFHRIEIARTGGRS